MPAHSAAEENSGQILRPAGGFPPTHWSMVLGAGKDSSPDAREAFGRLYQVYRPALVAFLRAQRLSEEVAGEIIQGFFEYLLVNRTLGKVRPEGRFRSWLLVCLKHYLADEFDKVSAKKRGGGIAHVAVGQDSEQGEVDLTSPGRSPDQEYDRQFALRFLQRVMARLEQDYAARGKTLLFHMLHPWLLEKKGGVPQADIGRQLGISEAHVNTEVSRLRKRYRIIFDEELLNLVGNPQDLAEEKNFLFAAVRR